MSSSLRGLLPLFQRERESGRALVLATVVRTDGPTYTKAGALMLIAQSGEDSTLPAGSGVFISDAAPFGSVAPSALAPLVEQQRAHGANQFMPQALPGVDVLGLI